MLLGWIRIPESKMLITGSHLEYLNAEDSLEILVSVGGERGSTAQQHSHPPTQRSPGLL